jgi:hypothetical protein
MYYLNHMCLYSLLLIFFLFSCKKSSLDDNNLSPITGTRKELTIDSLYLYAKEIYLWNEALPAYSTFLPRDRYINIAAEKDAVKKELFDITQLKVNKTTNIPYEFTNYDSPKYSFFEEKTTRASKLNAYSKETNIGNKIVVARVNDISYLAVHSFPELNNIKSDLDEAFSKIASYKLSTIVVDLRYNSGGYIETAEYLANLIAPSMLNGKLMYLESFNQTLQFRNTKILKNQPYLDSNGDIVIINGRKATMADVDYSEKGNTYFFNKKGNLESVKNIYFITSAKTASASEMLISLFKPYFNIKLVGEKTYGKPIGFFPIHIDKYSFYLSSFLIKNANGWSDYYSGMDPNIRVELSTNPILGDPNEACLKSIILDLYGNSKIAKTSQQIANREILKMKHPNKQLNKNVFFTENRLKLKNQ